ncbi:unnamed protein product, partial [marine sediment metagenome]
PVVISGSFTATYTDAYLAYNIDDEKYAKNPAYTGSTLEAEGELTLVATINDKTTAGVTFYTEEALEAAEVTVDTFFIDFADGEFFAKLYAGNIASGLKEHLQMD